MHSQLDLGVCANSSYLPINDIIHFFFNYLVDQSNILCFGSTQLVGMLIVNTHNHFCVLVLFCPYVLIYLW